MKYTKVSSVSLKEEYGLEGGELECVCMQTPFDGAPDWKRPAVIVVPGGGYSMVSRREAMPIASAFLARGFQTFVLTYLCCGDGVRYPEQLLELGCAVDYVKKHAEEFFVNPDEVFAVGFSAGGHLTANLAVEYPTLSEKLGREVEGKPAAVGLVYPVISTETGYVGSHNNLLNGYTDEAKEELLKTLNLDNAVSETTAPAFLLSTAQDALVPATNAMRFATALAKHKVDYELHVYPCGSHGGATFDYEVNTDRNPDFIRNRRWLDDCATFFRRYTKEVF
ncbi:MAG: alpha/beta hydrolase [Clostridia bacterium]|nr:alpha/beta hydrolase [Clostridia bacterium]